jgi:hypothetical protein
VNSSSRLSLRSDGYTPNFLKNESNAVQMPPPDPAVVVVRAYDRRANL